jgi:hypothetical protein
MAKQKGFGWSGCPTETCATELIGKTEKDMGNGKWEYFHPDGSLRFAGVYDNDQPVGIHQGFYANGELQYEIVYVDGKRHGISLNYNENGILEKSQLYLNGEIVLDKPILFAEGIISTKENQEFGITFTPDGKTAYFCRREAGKQAQKIYQSELKEEKWSKPEITKFSTDTDESPFITKDGKKTIGAHQKQSERKLTK